MRLSLLLLASLFTVPGRAAIDYTTFEHPAGDFSVRYPVDWSESFGVRALALRPAGPDGEDARVSLEAYPLGDSPRDAAAFKNALLRDAKGVKRLVSLKSVLVSGRPADRLEFVGTAGLKGLYGEPLPGPIHEVYVVVPLRDSYYVLRFQGLDGAYSRVLPEFEAMARSASFSR